MINIKNRVPAEVFLWHPQQMQLHGNTPMKQRQSRNLKSLNIIIVNKIWNGWLATSYSEVTINFQTAVPLLGHRPRNVFSIRWACATVEFLRRETPAFIPPDRWLANSLDLNPIDYCIWGSVQHYVYQKPVKDVDQLKQRLIEVLSGLQQTADRWKMR